MQCPSCFKFTGPQLEQPTVEDGPEIGFDGICKLEVRVQRCCKHCQLALQEGSISIEVPTVLKDESVGINIGEVEVHGEQRLQGKAMIIRVWGTVEATQLTTPPMTLTVNFSKEMPVSELERI